MIVYRRGLKKEDVLNLEPDEELIYYKDNNIAFTILGIDNKYVLRKKKIFNNQLVDERFVKTVEQIIKVVE